MQVRFLLSSTLMAKKALIERQKKRLILVRKFSFQRYQLKQQKKYLNYNNFHVIVLMFVYIIVVYYQVVQKVFFVISNFQDISYVKWLYPVCYLG
nr:30S ribosomal protein S14 [Halimeda borneensis]